MVDIFFKCEACGKHLVVDEARKGMPVECPACQAAIAIPTMLNVHQCPRCGQRLMISSQMKGDLLHCSACQEAIRAPGLTGECGAGENSVVIACPLCHANVDVTEEMLNRPIPCPSCGEQVYFRDPREIKGGQPAESPKPKGYDEFQFRRKSR
jgi:predicted RNA-binding Zn-ribbon protein involved in translation (DUF1610 family)